MLKKRISGVLLAGVLLLSGGTTAMAAENTTADIKDNLEVVKYFEMAEGLGTPTVGFKFTVEQSGQNPEGTPDLKVATADYTEKDTAQI